MAACQFGMKKALIVSGILLLVVVVSIVLRSEPPVAGVADSNTPESPPLRSVSGVMPDASLADKGFRDWQRAYVAGDTGFTVSNRTEVIAMARSRRERMGELIRNDPQGALREALSFSEYDRLPAELKAIVEQPFTVRADLVNLPVCPNPEQSPAERKRQLVANAGKPVDSLHGYRAFVEIRKPGQERADSFRAFLHGRREGVGTKNSVPIQGIRLDDISAIRVEPLQILDAEDKAWAEAALPTDHSVLDRDFLTGEPIAAERVIAVAGGQRFYFAKAENAERLNGSLAAMEELPGPNSGSQVLYQAFGEDGGFEIEAAAEAAHLQASVWTETKKKVFFIRVDFPDVTGESVAQTVLSNKVNTEVSDIIRTMSYGKTWLECEVSEMVVRLPANSSTYVPDDSGQLHDDAKAAFNALGAGINLDNYDVIGVHFKGIGMSYGGLAGGGRQWIQNSTGSGLITHEFGHNYGLGHSSSWDTTNGTVFVDGASTEYGDPFDIMGSGPYPQGEFHIQGKTKLNWMETNQWIDVTANGSGTYRLHRFDHRDAVLNQALRVTKAADEYYWLGNRRLFTDNRYSQKGIYMVWERPGESRSWLIDTTPGSAAGKDDAGVVIGRTYSDTNAAVHITPLSQGGISPNEWIDVRVNLGSFGGNQVPAGNIAGPATIAARVNQVYSSAVTDGDGDPLAYQWDMGDGSVQPNAAAVTHHWAVGGSYTVTLIVSDMKGGVVTNSMSVTVTDPLSNWTRINDVTNITTATLEDLTSTGTNLLAVGRNMALLSEDGMSWVKSAGIGGNFIPKAAKWDGSQFVVVGQDYDFDNSVWLGAIKTSPDGTNWTSRRKEGPILRDLAFGNGKLVGVGDNGLVLTSTDGASWTIQDSTLTNQIDGVAFGSGYFVAVSDTSPRKSVSSTDGVTWAAMDVTDNASLADIEFLRDRFLANGWYSKIRYSTNHGQSFLFQNQSTDYDTPAMTYGAGIFLAAGEFLNGPNDNKDLNAVSVDGVNWHEYVAPDQDNRTDAIFYNGRFITVGGGGSIWVSDQISSPSLSPVIVNQPANVIADQGDNVSFGVSANGTHPLAYQWRLNGADIAGATASLLSLGNIQAVNDGAYTVVVSNSAGSVTSSVAHLVVQLTNVAAPANDLLANATSLGYGSVSGSNLGASTEAGEAAPYGANSTPKRTVWYKWVSPFIGRATGSVAQAGLYPTLGIYRHSGGPVTFANLTKVAGFWGEGSVSMDFEAANGATYYLQLDDYFGRAMTNFSLGLGTQPRRVLGLLGDLAFGDVNAGASVVRTLTITNAGNAPIHVTGLSLPAGFSASYSGTIAGGSSVGVAVVFQPNVGSYGGTAKVHSDANGGVAQLGVSGTGILAAGYAISPTSVNAPFAGTSFNATITIPAGVQWGAFSTNSWIAVRTPTNGVGAGSITIDVAGNFLPNGRTGQVVIPPLTLEVIQAAAPFNDNLSDALNLDIGITLGKARSINLTGTTTGATVEANEPRAFESNTTPMHSVWYKWTAPANIRASFTASRSGENVLLGVYTNNGGALAVDNLTKITGTWGGSSVSRNISAQAGVVYYIQVDTYFGAEMPSFAFAATVSAPPENDDFANATEVFLTQATNVFTGNTLSASAEANEQNGTGAGNATLDRSVWYKWRATLNGDISATLERVGHGGTPVLAIYTANGSPSVDNLTKLTGTWGQPTVTRTRTVTSGTDYYFQLDEYFGNEMDPYQFTLVVPDAISNLPPTVVSQPAAANGVAGSTLNLSVVAGGGSPFSYQWKKDGADIGGATQSTLVLANVQASDAGAYTVQISNAAGNVTSSAANISVSGAAPFIAAQSGSLVLNVGANTNLFVTATGSGPLTYQWRKNGLDINGATSPTLAISGVNTSHEGVYSVLVANGSGSRESVASEVVVINPATAPAIARSLLVDLLATSATAGGSQWNNPGDLGGVFNRQGEAALVVDVNGTGIRGVSFDGTNDGYLGPVTVSDLEGNSDRSIEVWAYNPELPIEETMVSLGHRGSTRRVVQLNFGNNGTYGAATHWSDDLGWNGSTPSASNWHHLVYTYSNQVAKVFVNGAEVNSKTLGGALDTYAGEAIKVAFAEQSNGDRALSFSGFLNTVRIHGGALDVAQILHNFRRGPAQPIVAQQAPSITSQPTGVTANALSSAQFNVAANGSALLSYQWRRNGVNLGGATGSTLTLNNVSTNDQGDYTVVVSNGAGSVTSVAATLTVNRLAPSLTWSAPGTVVYGSALGAAQLNASSPAAGSLVYNPGAGTVLSAGSHTLDVEFTPNNPAVYSNDNASVSLTVSPAPLTITADNKVKQAGAANPPLTASYSGFVNGETNTVLTAQPSLSTPATAGSPAAVYQIVVSGATAANYNISHVNGTLTVQNVPLTITQQPVGQAVAPLRSALLSVVATSSAPLSYQWQKNGVDVANATGASLNLRGVTTNDVADYRVVLDNGSSRLTSSVAAVTLNVGAPVIHVRGGDLIAEAQRHENFAGGAFDENTGTYVVPAPNVLQQFRNAAAELWTGNLDGAVAHVANVGYEGVIFRDTNYNRTYFGLQPAETNGVPISGWGIYFVDTNSLIAALVEAPHPNSDFRSPLLSAEVLLKSGSRGFLLAGAHRNANGSQTADVAHLTNSVFHVVHETWAGQNGQNTAWQIHGYGTNNYPQFPSGHEAILSTGEDDPNFMSANIANLDTHLEAAGVATYAFTKNMPTNHPLNLQVNGAIDGFTFQPLGARSNDQGLVSRARGGTFVHLEFAKHRRTDPALRTSTAGAIANAILASGDPPVITQQPIGATVNMLESVNLSVGATGTPPLWYQWRQDGNDVPGATNAALSIASAMTNTPGSYDVRVSNYAGSTTSAPVAVVVNRLTPQVTWGGPAPLVYGTPLSAMQLSATATVPGTFMYQPPAGTFLPAGQRQLQVTFHPADAGTYNQVTRFNTQIVSPATLLFRAIDKSRPEGQANPPLTILFNGFVNGDGTNSLTTQPTVSTTATPASPSGNYPIVVAGGSSSNYTITRMNGTLSIAPRPPVITQQPVGTNISVGENFALRVVTSGSEPLTYIWTQNGGTIGSVNGPILQVTNATATQTGSYRVQVTNVAGSVTSDIAIVSVGKLPQTITFDALPNLQPGQSNYTLQATSSSGLPVQFTSEKLHVAKVVGNQMTMRLWGTSLITASQAGDDSYAPAQPVSLLLQHVAPVPQLPNNPTVHQVTGRLEPPYTNNFYVSVGGLPPVSIQAGTNWLGRKIPQAGLITTELELPMFDGDRLLKYSRKRGVFDIYRYFGSNWFPHEPEIEVGEGFQLITDTTRDWDVTPQIAGGFTKNTLAGSAMWVTTLQPADSNFTVNAILENPPQGLRLVKQQNNVLVTNVFSSGSWTDPNMLIPLGEAYLLSVENETLVPVNRTFSPGTDLRLRVGASHAGQFQWRRNGSSIAGGTNDVLPLFKLTPADTGSYDVIVSNPSGSVTSSVVNISIGGLPLISQPPAGLVKTRGETATFAVTATGLAPLSYQWLREQLPLSGATNSQLVISNVSRNHRGIYAVEVTNSLGNVTSPGALLRVLSPTRLHSIVRTPSGQLRIRFGDDDGFLLPADLAGGFVIEASSDFRIWQAISTNAAGLSLSNGSFEFEDTGATNQPVRFYRVLER